MPYTLRQLQCLNAMGIVPWVEHKHVSSTSMGGESAAATGLVERLSSELESQLVHDDSATRHKQAPETRLVSDAKAASPPHKSTGVDATPVTNGSWIDTALVSMSFKGNMHVRLGRSDAPLLILAEQCGSSQTQYPFEATDAKMFDDMLRAISWNKRDVCLALLPGTDVPNTHANGDTQASSQGKCVCDLLGQHIKVILIFVHEIDESQNPSDSLKTLDRDALVSSSLKIWQLPHPALLRSQPGRKRQAWNILKAAQTQLQKV